MKMNYFVGNKELAIAALNVLDGMRGQIQRELKVNVKEIEKENVEQNDGEEEPPSPFVAFKTAVVLLGEMTRNGFNRLRENIMKEFKCTGKAIPSFHDMTKNRPTIIPIFFGSKTRDDDDNNDNGDDNDDDNNNNNNDNKDDDNSHLFLQLDKSLAQRPGASGR